MSKRLFSFAAVCTLTIFCALPALCQFGALEGDVKDAEGKPLVGALITLDRTDIKGHYQVKTDKKGHYYHGGLPLGTFRVSLKQGEQVLMFFDGVRIRPGDPMVVNFDLKVEQQRQQAVQAGVLSPTAPSRPGQQDVPKLSKEQLAKIQEEQTKRESARKKSEQLNTKFGSGVEALKLAQFAQRAVERGGFLASEAEAPKLALVAGITLPPGGGLVRLTPEQRPVVESFRNENLQTSVTDLEAAAQLDASQHVIFANLGEAYVNLARAKSGEERKQALAKSHEAYQKAIALKPDDASYHNNYGLALANAGMIPEAQAELSKAAQLDPANAGRYYYNLGAVLTNIGKVDEAADAFRNATKTDPNYADAHYQLGIALSSKAQLDSKTGKIAPVPGTVEELQKYLELQPDGPYAEAAKALIQQFGATVETVIKQQKPTPATRKKQ